MDDGWSLSRFHFTPTCARHWLTVHDVIYNREYEVCNCLLSYLPNKSFFVPHSDLKEVTYKYRIMFHCKRDLNCQVVCLARLWMLILSHAKSRIFIDREAGEIIRLEASVCLCVCLFGCMSKLSCLNCLTYDLDFSHEGRPWPWLAWDRRSRSWVKGLSQTVKKYIW